MCKCIACTDPWCIGLHPPTWVGQHHEWRQGVSRRWISRDEFLPPNREELGPKALNGGCRMFGNASIVAQAWHFEAWRASCLVPLFFFASGLQNRTAIHFICKSNWHTRKPRIEILRQSAAWEFILWKRVLCFFGQYFPHPIIRLEGAVRLLIKGPCVTQLGPSGSWSRLEAEFWLEFSSRGTPLYWHFLKSLCWYQLWKMKKGHLGFSGAVGVPKPRRKGWISHPSRCR